MRRFTLASAVLMTLAMVSQEAMARPCRPARARARVVVRLTPRRVVVKARSRAVVPVAMAVPVAAPMVSAPAVVPSGQAMAPANDAAAFLAALNAWRASAGRPPLSWDATLASYAATNYGQHSTGSSGGGSQAWSPVTSLTASLSLWISSPSHAALLLNATTSVGASPCPSGATANVR